MGRVQSVPLAPPPPERKPLPAPLRPPPGITTARVHVRPNLWAARMEAEAAGKPEDSGEWAASMEAVGQPVGSGEADNAVDNSCIDSDNAVDDSGPGAYVDSTLLDEADEEAAGAEEEIAHTVDVAEEAEEELADLEEAGLGLEDDALDDEVVQAMLLQDAGLRETAAMDEAGDESWEGGGERRAWEAAEATVLLDEDEDELQCEDDAFLDTIYES